MSKKSAEKIYLIIREVYTELYGSEISESKSMIVSPEMYKSILKNSAKNNISPYYIAKIMGVKFQSETT